MRNQIAAESKRRCIIAADQVASIMKMASHTDLSVVRLGDLCKREGLFPWRQLTTRS
jgi:hypothetical protein